MLDLYKLEIFARAAEAGSFSKAALQLHMTQSAVSQHVTGLEERLGAVLFQRGRQGVRLTAAGRTLYDYAAAIFRLVAEAELQVADVRHMRGGQINVGATPGVSSYLLPDWIQSYRRQFPHLLINLQTGVTSEIVTGVLEGSLALGLIEGEPAPEEHNRLTVVDLEEVDQPVVIGPQHPWWERPVIELQELDRQPMVMRQAGSQTRSWLDRMLQDHGVQPRMVAEFDNLESIKRVVMGGASLAILPNYVIRDECARGALRAIPLAGALLRRTLKLVWSRATPLSPIGRSFLLHLADYFPVLGRVVSG